MKTEKLLQKALQEVRRISRNLRPGELDDLGLVTAMQGVCCEFMERTGVKIRFYHSRLPERFSSDKELTLYRIVQEALTNVEKHARARQVILSLRRKGMLVELKIKDDGIGFSEQNRRRGASGSGLINMRERAGFIEGVCTVESIPRKGTEVIVRFPLNISKKKN